jgi:acyl-CoA reductase-like NAD-dependent aldehyde dehydrogenase
LRRILLHESVYDSFLEKIKKVYESIRIGSPLDSQTLMGPLHTKGAVKEYLDGLEEIKK